MPQCQNASMSNTTITKCCNEKMLKWQFGAMKKCHNDKTPQWQNVIMSKKISMASWKNTNNLAKILKAVNILNAPNPFNFVLIFW